MSVLCWEYDECAFFFQYGSAKDIMCNVPLSKVIYRLQNFIGFAKYKLRIADDLFVKSVSRSTQIFFVSWLDEEPRKV